MANNNSGVASSGSWFLCALTIVFITLKLTDQIDWSWWWVLAPLWIPFALLLVIVLIGVVIVTTRKGSNN